MSSPRPQLIIAGGGLAGCLAALALTQRRPDVDFLLIEEASGFGGNHVWSFFDSDVAPSDRGLIKPLAPRHWADHEVLFPRRKRVIDVGYNSLRSPQLDRTMRQTIAPERYRLQSSIQDLGPNHVIADGERIEAEGVIDARGAGPSPSLQVAWQKFLGRIYRYDRPHGRNRPIIMDALVDQQDGYRFVYSLPLGERELMIEDTYYSTDPGLDVAELGRGLDRVAAEYGSAEQVGEETGVLPIVLDGELEALWPADAAPVARLGMRGGFFHPTTGYSLPDAVRNAALLCEQQDLRSEALHALFRHRASALWEKRRFFQMLNRMLFMAAQPRQRYRVMEYFYRLPPALIARFYAAELTSLDKLRILTGWPPVPIGRAIAAIRSKAA